MKTEIKLFFLPAIAAGIFFFNSCSTDIPEIAESAYPLALKVDVAGSTVLQTRAIRTNTGDQWSYEAGQSFRTGDLMGFYASAGNASGGNDGSRPFINQMLRFNGTQFDDPDYGAIFSPTYMTNAQILMYYEYNPDAGTTGIPLRVKPSEDNDTLRCIDFLISDKITAIEGNKALYGSFGHGFSELIIMRGEGFDAPPEGKWMINVVMSQPVTHMLIETTEEPWSCKPTLVYDNTELSEEEARRWTAWRAYNYGITENDPDGEPAWYVIVPSLASQYATIEFIELYDNEGYLQRVSSLRLYNDTKTVKPGWRYPVKIAMRELVPTVNPFPIMPWGEEINLTDARTRGINDATDFANWVKDYNAYLVDPDNTTKRDVLLNYGDKYIDSEGNVSWHFYLLSNLDLSGYQALPYEGSNGDMIDPADNVIIPVFHDILDGKSTNIVNGEFESYKISNLEKTFIGSLTPWENAANECSVTNIDFIDADVRYDASNTTAVGIIANTMLDASVINCNIDGTLMNSGGPAGMITGSMTGGTLKDCVLSGFIIYNSTSTDYAKIVGEEPMGVEIENVNASAVVSGNN